MEGYVITRNKKTGKLTQYATGYIRPMVLDDLLVPVPEDEEIYTDPIPEDAEVDFCYIHKIMIPNPDMCKELLTLCSTTPVDFEAVSEYIKINCPDEYTLTKVLLDYMEGCFWEYSEFIDARDDQAAQTELAVDYFEPLRNAVEEDISKMKSAYLYDLAKLFCEYGIDPNVNIEGENVMEKLQTIDYEYVVADVLKLFLDNGGNANLRINDESIFDEVDFDVFFYAVEQLQGMQYDVLIHYWMVFVGYGAKLENGRDPVTLDSDCTLEMFKDHRNLDFCLAHDDGHRKLYIFDRRTKWRIATADL